MFAHAPSGPQLKRFKTAIMSRDPSPLVIYLFWYIFIFLFQPDLPALAASSADAAPTVEASKTALLTECRRKFATTYAKKFILLDAGDFSSKLGLFLSETVLILFEQTFDTSVSNPFDNFLVEQIYYIINNELFGISLASTTITHFRQAFFRARHRSTLANTFVHRPFVPANFAQLPVITTVDTSPVVSLLSHRTKVFTKDDPGWKIRCRISASPRRQKVANPGSNNPAEAADQLAAESTAMTVRKTQVKTTGLTNSPKDIEKFMLLTHAPLVADSQLIDAHYNGRPRLIMPVVNT